MSFLGTLAKQRGWADGRDEERMWVGWIIVINSVPLEHTGGPRSGDGFGRCLRQVMDRGKYGPRLFRVFWTVEEQEPCVGLGLVCGWSWAGAEGHWGRKMGC